MCCIYQKVALANGRRQRSWRVSRQSKPRLQARLRVGGMKAAARAAFKRDLPVDLRAHDGNRFLVHASSIPLLDHFEIGLTFLIARTWFPSFLAQEIGC